MWPDQLEPGLWSEGEEEAAEQRAARSITRMITGGGTAESSHNCERRRPRAQQPQECRRQREIELPAILNSASASTEQDESRSAELATISRITSFVLFTFLTPLCVFGNHDQQRQRDSRSKLQWHRQEE